MGNLPTSGKTNLEVIQKYFPQKQAERKEGYKWDFNKFGDTQGSGKVGIGKPALALIDGFKKSDADENKDGIVANKAELDKFLTYASGWDKIDPSQNREALNYLRTEFGKVFAGITPAPDFDAALGRLLNENELNSDNSVSDLLKGKDIQAYYIREMLLELRESPGDLDRIIQSLEAQASRDTVAEAKLNRLRTLKTNANLAELQRQGISIYERNMAEESISSFFTRQETNGSFIIDNAKEKNIDQIAVDSTGQPIETVVDNGDGTTTPRTGPVDPMNPTPGDNKTIDRAKDYANSKGVGSADTIGWLADRASSRLAEIKARIDTPEIEEAIAAFYNKAKSIPEKMNTRRVSISHILGGNISGGDLQGVFDEVINNVKFEETIIRNINESKDKEGVENTYNFFTGLLKQYYSEDYGKAVRENKFQETIAKDASLEDIKKYVTGMKEIFQKYAKENREFIKKVNEILGKGNDAGEGGFIVESDGKRSSIWKILGYSASSGQDVRLSEGYSFNNTFPATMSDFIVNTAKAAGVTFSKKTDINTYITKSVEEPNQKKVREEVANFAKTQLKDGLKKGNLELVKGGLIDSLNQKVGLTINGKLVNEIKPEDKLTVQIIIGQLILIEQALGVKDTLMATKGTQPFFDQGAVRSIQGTSSKVSDRVRGLLGEFKKQEEAYDQLLSDTAKDTLGPLGQALNGIFNFDVGYSFVRSYAYMKSDLDITRALVSITINNKVNDVITKRRLADGGAKSIGNDPQKPASEQTADSATILGFINSSIQNLVGVASKQQETMAETGKSLIDGVTNSLKTAGEGFKAT